MKEENILLEVATYVEQKLSGEGVVMTGGTSSESEIWLKT